MKEYDNFIAFHDDATQDEALEKAGIYRAKGLIAALNSDANNLYTVLAARQIKPDLLIVARATHTILTTSLFELAQKRPFLQTRSVGIGWLLC
ncbi:MAG: NAD-binding protein [Alkalibacterium sp.]